MPLIEIVMTSMGALPERVTTLVVLEKSPPPLLVTANGAFTVLSWPTRNARRPAIQFLTPVGAARVWPALRVTPELVSAAYLPSISGLIFSAVIASTANLMLRKKARRNGGCANMRATVGSSTGVKSGEFTL